ncbi:endolysin [Pseudomonas phage vB_PcuM_ KLEP17-4]|nr:endolysin [Pseudomonas phage vB_PcuM_ KLEP17-4]
MKVKGKLVPLALVAALTGGGSIAALERLEGNVLGVYADELAGGLPTRCAGDTNHNMPVGTKLTADDCREINKLTMLKYGAAVLACTRWEHLNGDRLVGLTLFAINVGKNGACNSQSFKAINAGRVTDGCNLLSTRPDGKPNWSYIRDRYIQGLQDRRLAERKLCLSGVAT